MQLHTVPTSTSVIWITLQNGKPQDC